MKKIIFLSLLASFLALAVEAQTSVYSPKGTLTYYTSTDSAYTTVATVAVSDTSAGLIEVSVVGMADSLGVGVTGQQIARYNKTNGTLTLGTPTSISAKVTDTALGTATWDITTSSNNIIIRIKGKLNYTIYWRVAITRVDVKNHT